MNLDAENVGHDFKRELSPDERERLVKLSKEWSRFPFYMIIFSSIFSGFCFYFLWDLFKDYFADYSYLFMISLIILPLLSAFHIASLNKRMAKRYLLDLNQPVLATSGKVFIAPASMFITPYTPLTPKYPVWVNNVRFNGLQEIDGKTLTSVIHQSEIVNIQYSPNSNHIWKIDRVV